MGIKVRLVFFDFVYYLVFVRESWSTTSLLVKLQLKQWHSSPDFPCNLNQIRWASLPALLSCAERLFALEQLYISTRGGCASGADEMNAQIGTYISWFRDLVLCLILSLCFLGALCTSYRAGRQSWEQWWDPGFLLEVGVLDAFCSMDKIFLSTL